MPHHGRPALHRVCDTVSGVNWRPTRFADELMLARHACCVCHVISSTTVLLPCFHALCEQCQAGSVVEDGGSACPLDGELFCEDELQKLQLPDRKKPNLKAYCWNEAHGCDFVGPLAMLLQHFEKECAFHTSRCQRCSENIPNARLAAHYMGGCCASNLSSAMLAESSPQSQPAAATRDVTPTARGVEVPAGNAYEDEIPTLQSQVNELTQATRTQGAQLQELNATLAVSLQTMNAAVVAAAEKFSEAIGAAPQQHERMLASREEDSSRSQEAEATASDSGVLVSLQGEATDILRNLENLTVQSRLYLERLLSAHNDTIRIPEAHISIISQRRGMRTHEDSGTCTSSCENVNEIVYLMVVSDVRDLEEHRNPRVVCRLGCRRAWCSVAFGKVLRNGVPQWGLRLIWSTCSTSSSLPHVVYVKSAKPHPCHYDFVRRQEDYDPRQQVYFLRYFTRTKFTEHSLQVHICIHDCE
ncbi:uncharacterized protein LOC125939685 [Dermacentor silvarum]|uniref:uncharacterized protein LOC125939685 n=1 Tax=Dermacentor silvarum TaxID=543639 RepID=UPI002100FB1C|nr:uncharacterized protein LOC125939685 [Dermacentor silvarum]